MNTTTKCPVCPFEDVPPTALQCPNCKTDLTLLRRIETLADRFVRDAETRRDTDPRGALRALHTALSLEPQNEAYQRRATGAEAALDQENASPLREMPATVSAPRAATVVRAHQHASGAKKTTALKRSAARAGGSLRRPGASCALRLSPRDRLRELEALTSYERGSQRVAFGPVWYRARE